MSKIYIPIVIAPDNSFDVAKEIFELIATDERQNRQKLEWKDTLYGVADTKVRRMAELRDITHDTDGRSPNRWLSDSGYRLPDGYPRDGNSIESSALHSFGAKHIVEAWAKSSGHASHIWGGNRFFHTQTLACVATFRANNLTYAVFWSIHDN